MEQHRTGQAVSMTKRNTHPGVRTLFLETLARRLRSPCEGGCRLTQFTFIRLLVKLFATGMTLADRKISD